MPYEWVDPELFLEHEGVAVYHCYDDGDMVSSYWYTTDPSDCNYKFPEIGSKAQFDVRDLPDLGLAVDEPTNHALIIEHAIEEGLITGEPTRETTSDEMERESLVVRIEVIDGVAEVVEKPPNVAVVIIDHDMVDERDPCNPDMTKMPTLETLMQWEAEGGCEAVDGCWCEPDGVCPHGCKSWMLVLGLI